MRLRRSRATWAPTCDSTQSVMQGLSGDPARDPCRPSTRITVMARPRSGDLLTWQQAISKPRSIVSARPCNGTTRSRFGSTPMGRSGASSRAIISCGGLGHAADPDRDQSLGNQIASAASTTLSTKKPIVSVSILYRDRPIRAQVIQPPAVEGGFSISLRFFSSLPLEAIKLGFLYGKERSPRRLAP